MEKYNGKSPAKSANQFWATANQVENCVAVTAVFR